MKIHIALNTDEQVITGNLSSPYRLWRNAI
jgi:hypothetical protein